MRGAGNLGFRVLVVVGEGRGWGSGYLVGKGHVTGSTEAADISAVLVLDAKEGPHPPSADFGQANEEAEEGRVLQVVAEEDVKDPVEAENRVKKHSQVIDPGAFITQNVAEEGVCGVWVA